MRPSGARIHATHAAALPAWIVLFAGTTTASQAGSEERDSPPAAQDRDAIVVSAGSDQAFVELATEREDYWVHESIRLRLRFGFERRFLGESMIQLFLKELDVPAQVLARWSEDLAGTTSTGTPGPSEGGGPLRTVALDDGIASARELPDRVADGRNFAVLELARTLLPDRPGTLTIPPPALRFAYATEFREDLLGGRVAVDRRDALVHGAPLVLRIHALPEEGRPFDFTGAVGRFSVRAAAEPRAVDAGASLRLTLAIEGEGNFGHFDAPRLDALSDFDVLGTIPETGAGRATFTYDLAPRGAGVESVPAIPFPYFQPDPPPGYRTVYTEAIPIVVGPRPAGPGAGGGRVRAVPGVNDIFDLKPAAERAGEGDARRPSRLGTAAALAGPWLLALGFVALRRARKRRRADPEDVRARGAAAAFMARAREKDSDVGAALADYLAARLRCTAAAVIGPDLERRLKAAGVSTELAARAHALLEHLVHARFGGAQHDDAAAAAGALVDTLEAAFRGAA